MQNVSESNPNWTRQPSGFYLDWSVYRRLDLKHPDVANLNPADRTLLAYRILYFKGTLDSYCVECEDDSIFNSMGSAPRALADIMEMLSDETAAAKANSLLASM